MSGRAVNWVWDNHNTSGTKLTVLLAIAKLSHKSKHPFKSFCSYGSIAKLCGITERYTIKTVAMLIKDEQLSMTRRGEGSRANLYDPLPLVGMNSRPVKGMNTCSPSQQRRAIENDELLQETPLANSDQLAVHDPTPVIPPNVIQYPKPNRKRHPKAQSP